MSLIGMWSQSAQTYLLVLTIVTFIAFSALLFLKPLTWGRLLTWRIPDETDLIVYFGRCLGSFAIVTNIMMLVAALTGVGVVFILQFFTLFCLLMVVVHIWGAILKIQPLIETLEIGFWAMLVILNLLFYPV